MNRLANHQMEHENRNTKYRKKERSKKKVFSSFVLSLFRAFVILF